MKDYGTNKERNAEIEAVSKVMRENVNEVMKRGENLENMKETAVNLCKFLGFFSPVLLPLLAEAADNFQTMSKSVAAKYRWEKLKYSNLFKNKQTFTTSLPQSEKPVQGQICKFLMQRP